MFYVKNEADALQVKQMAQQLIEKSRLEEGNLSYDLFQGSTPICLLFCETWRDDDVFKAHLATPHYRSIMPRIQQISHSCRGKGNHWAYPIEISLRG